MRVAEHDATAVHGPEQRLLARRRLRQEALHVRYRRAVAVEDARASETSRQRGQLAHEVSAEQLGAPLDRAVHRLRRIVRLGCPSLSVAADPFGIELAQTLD